MRQLSTLLFALLPLSASACGYTTSPLSDAKTTILDEDLIGTWEFEKDVARGQGIHVLRRAP